MRISNHTLRKLKRGSAITYILVFTTLCFLVNFVFSFLIILSDQILELKFDFSAGPLKDSSLAAKFVAGSFVAPLVETFLFQYLPIEILKKKLSRGYLLIFSSALFGLSHFYSIPYMLKTFLIGLVLAASYVFWIQQKPHKFIITVSFHSLFNSIITFTSAFF